MGVHGIRDGFVFADRCAVALVADLLALAAQSARIIKRLPKTVQLDLAQQVNASVALDDLDVFTKRVRQIAAIRTVSVPAQRQAQRRPQREKTTA
ncbi:hypothetical protein [Nonomuraea diastatica]|uniref:hypothetical protein n=1 Tax=Nonomuraea diastatica TaxID=1848329 RepID=UPI001FE42F86|nr:hypothetical protein [Nonomuraea diastatica]